MASWPPESLTIQTEDLINQCELMEVLPASAEGKQFVPVVELAALLYTGEYVHARHLWRRWKESNPPSYLADWWAVGAAMITLSFGGNSSSNITQVAATLWNGLAHIQATHPAPINFYATEVGMAYRTRVVQHCCGNRGATRVVSQPPPPQPYWTLLHFSGTAEWEQFCRESSSTNTAMTSHPTTTSTSIDLAMDAKTSLTQVVAFLESKPPVSSGNNTTSGNSNSGSATTVTARA